MFIFLYTWTLVLVWLAIKYDQMTVKKRKLLIYTRLNS